jgi:Zn-dependent peptidase ImmA (M78 family)
MKTVKEIILIANGFRTQNKLGFPVDSRSVLKLLNVPLIQIQMGTDIDAITMYCPETNGYIVFEKPLLDGEDSNRSNFSLAHELGHIVLKHRLKDINEETRGQSMEANWFAGELLMPVKEFLSCPPQLRRTTFCVSAQAAETRTHKLEQLFKKHPEYYRLY